MSLEFQALDKSIDRGNFDCGIPELNIFIERQARQQQEKGLNRTFVLVNKSKVLGFYSLSMAEMNLNSLPEEKKKKLPRHSIPVARIGRLAVDSSAKGKGKGKGYGKLLLVDALTRIQKASLQVGVYAVIVDAKNSTAANFYKNFGFIPFKDTPLSLFISLASLPK